MNRDEALFRALFAPSSVALVGASGDAGRSTARPQRFLQGQGYAGKIYPVNARRAEVLGLPAHASLDAIPAPIDHALIMLPTAQVAAAIEACGRRGVPVATIFSDGFAEVGPEGAARQRELVALARAAGVRLLGPNSIGLVSVDARLPLTVNAALEGGLPAPGRTALVSQSGSMLGTILSRGQARGVGFSRLVSVGNEADLGVGELVELLVGDPGTDTILLFLETVRDAPRLAAAARAAWRAGKPVIAYKLGRSAVGEQLARSHTGAIAGSDAAASAYFAAHGIVRVELLETLLEIGPLLRSRGAGGSGIEAPRTPVAAPAIAAHVPRIAVVSTTGGGAAMVADRLGTLGLDIVAPPPAFVERMHAAGAPIRSAPIIDLTLAVTPSQYATVLQGLLDDDFCDAVLAVVGTSAQFQPELAVRPILQVAGAGATAKPLAVFLAPQADASLALLAEHGIAAFRTPEACADALACALRRVPPDPSCAPLAGESAEAGAGRETGGKSGRETGRETVANAGAATRTLDEVDSLALFDALGIPTVPREVLTAAPWRHAIPYPVAVKLVSPELAHKTEAGAVSLDIADDDACDAAIGTMLASVAGLAPRPLVRAVMVQQMTRGLAEVLLGYRRDPAVGPVVVLGVGGRLAEIYGDVAVRIAPVSLDAAHAMIAQVRGLAPIRGYRGLPRGDLDALARAVVAMGELARHAGPQVLEAEINPLLVRTDGVVALDGLVVRRAD